MTTIAYRAGVIASDTLVSDDGSHVGQTRKIRRFREGCLTGAAGDMAVCQAFLNWIPKQLDFMKSRFELHSDENFGAFVFDPMIGHIIRFSGHGRPLMVSAEFVALGSGADFAMGAMAHGATAVEAVRAAMHLDPWTGGNIEFASFSGALNGEIEAS